MSVNSDWRAVDGHWTLLPDGSIHSMHKSVGEAVQAARRFLKTKLVRLKIVSVEEVGW